ncbi:MAG: UDP-2,3-diacylglucosamine diphosphatase LpxI [Acidaminococcaceae bacterium]|nr:UDP-2,3-diacylglucosamine diphosphatase LpxI [Acidaminococcaceae bacterium]
METLGILAGVGHLPVEVARSAKKLGYEVIAIALVPGTDAELADSVDSYYEINVGRVGKIISVLKQHHVAKVTMIGKVTKEVLYKVGAIVPDLRALKILASVPDRRDDTLMKAIVYELESEGMEVMDQTILIKPLLPAPGVLTKRAPTETELVDMDFGFTMAKAIGGLDIGQTVVVKNRAVMAVEAIEGTDACILRGGYLGKGGVIVAKTAKPAQDQRFDIPGFGTKTLEAMIHAGATGIIIESGNTLIVEREKTIALADANNITIVVR